MPNILIHKERCKGCERCVVDCPTQIIKMSKDMNVKGYFHACVPDSSSCLGCRTCALTCPDLAIDVQINGAKYTFFEY